MELGCPLDVAFQGVDKKKKEKKSKRKEIVQEENIENVLPYTPEQDKQKYMEVKEEQVMNDNFVKISNEEYEAFKKYQLERYIKIRENGIQQQQNFKEGFSNVNDDFNDVLLFGLMGIFFLIFTDYIYKLGKRSY